MSTALVLIDIQNDYFSGGAMELVGTEAAAQKAAQLLAAFRAKGQPVVHIQHLATRLGATFFLPGTPGADIHSSVRPLQQPLQRCTETRPSGAAKARLGTRSTHMGNAECSQGVL